MPCGDTTGASFERVNATTGTFATIWLTDWTSCVGLDSIMATLRGRACSSDFLECQLVQQTANVRVDKPNLPILKGSVQAPTSGSFSYNTGTLDISGDTAPAAYVRWGVSYRFASGQSQASGDVGLDVAYIRCGEVVEAGSWQLDTSTTATRYILLGDWIPAILVNKAKLAAICTNLSGPLQWRLVMRTAATDTEEPGAWANVTDANAPYASGEVNTGDLSVSPGSTVMWVQFAIAYSLSSSGTGQASISAALGVRRS